MQGYAGNARLVATAAEAVGAVVGREFSQVRKQWASGRQMLQYPFQCVADRELRPRAGLLPEIGDRPGLPVNVLGSHVRGVTLRRAGFPKQF